MAETSNSVSSWPGFVDQLNKTFRDAHVKSRTLVLERSGPIIVVDFDTLILLHRKSRTEIEVVPVVADLRNSPALVKTAPSPYGIGRSV